nr:uncharacterized protein I203_06341 [Kwoniella mangroviensis CBS 8507]OCF64608.1 hypothetical protein I203_06341 [Kwoniella mangroviensis CBS 8507]
MTFLCSKESVKTKLMNRAKLMKILHNDSFNTLMFPPKPHQLSILLDVLIGLDIRFILAQGVASVELQLLAKQKILTKDYDDKAMLIPWANQFAVLSHEATGWFLNHGGSNSTMKGLKTEAPIVFWPDDVHQVWISSSLS